MFSGLDLYITTETSLGHQNRFRNEGLVHLTKNGLEKKDRQIDGRSADNCVFFLKRKNTLKNTYIQELKKKVESEKLISKYTYQSVKDDQFI